MDDVISKVKFLELPLAIVTIIVSPIAREIAKTMAAIIPDRAAGITAFKVTSNLEAPRPRAPSLILCGTAFMASSDKEATMGIIMIPMTNPGLNILVESRPGITFRSEEHTSELQS